MTHATHFRRQLGSALCAALLAACGGGDGSPGEPGTGPAACVALPAEVTWQRDTLSSAWNDVLIDGRNRIWLAGYTNGSLGQSNIEPSGNSRAVLRQWSPAGALLWDAGAAFDTPGTDVAEALAMGAQGTLYVAGRSTGTYAGQVNRGQFDSFVLWSDSPGSTVPWRAFQTGDAAPQHPRRLALDDQGDLLLAGEDDDFVPSNYVAAWSDGFALRLRRQGAGTADDRLTTVWQYQAASPEPDVGGGLAVAASGAGGATFISGATLGGTARGMFLRKLAADGQPLWTARYSSSAVDHIAAVQVLADGTLLVAGSVFGPFRGGDWRGQQDVFVARVGAADGQVLQSWQFGSTETDWLTDMRIDAAGHIYLFGETSGSVAPGAVPAGQGDLFLLKLSADGQVLAARQWGSADDERAARLALDSCGGIVAVGSSGSATRRDALVWFWRP